MKGSDEKQKNKEGKLTGDKALDPLKLTEERGGREG